MPASTPNPHRVQAGAFFRTLRLLREWTLGDVERESIRRWGADGAILKAQCSRIESGYFDRVSLDDAVRLGAIYALTPDQVAALYGLWPRDAGSALTRPGQIEEAAALCPTLPDDIRADYLAWIAFATMQARAKALARLRATGEGETAGTATAPVDDR